MNSSSEHFVEARVVTTAGVFPASEFEREPANQPISVLLKKAQSALKITDTKNWIAIVRGNRIDPARSYTENRLEGRVEIDWGPDHGGGGNA